MFYRNVAFPYDWFTSSSDLIYQDNFLWTEYDNHKSQYDPCPAGWRVPNLEHGQSTGTSLWEQMEREDVARENNRLLGFLMRRKSDHTGRLFLPAGSLFEYWGSFNSEERTANYNANAYPYDDLPEMLLYSFQGEGGGASEGAVPRGSAIPVRCIKRTN